MIPILMPGRLGKAAGGPPPFSPLDIANCSLWLDPSDATTLTLGTAKGGGFHVNDITDKSANGYVLTTAADASRPGSGITTINGLDTLDFDGGDEMEATNAPINNASDGSWTIYAVGRPTNTSGIRLLLSGDPSSGTRIGQYLRNNGATPESIAFSGGSPYTDTVGTTIAANNTYLYASYHSGTALELKIDNSGNGSLATPSQNYLSTIFLRLGYYATGNSRWLGQIAEVVAYSRLLNGTEDGQVRDYLTAKWGL